MPPVAALWRWYTLTVSADATQATTRARHVSCKPVTLRGLFEPSAVKAARSVLRGAAAGEVTSTA